MPEPKDTITAVLGASTALAGLLLVFVGFVYAHGESFKTRTGDKFKIVAKLGMVPFLISLASVWAGLEWLTGDQWAYSWCVWSFRATVVITAAYGALTLLFYL